MRILCLLGLLVLGACSIEQISPQAQLNGNYQGTFTRSAPSVDYERALVSLTLSSGSFEGTSQIKNYPAICRGAYTASNSRINFKDACAWTADFDWTLILDGEYRLISHSDSLVFSRKQGEFTDTYQLKRLD